MHSRFTYTGDKCYLDSRNKFYTPEEVFNLVFESCDNDFSLKEISYLHDYLVAYILKVQDTEPVRVVVADSRGLSDDRSDNLHKNLVHYSNTLSKYDGSGQKIIHLQNKEGHLPEGVFEDSHLPPIND